MRDELYLIPLTDIHLYSNYTRRQKSMGTEEQSAFFS